MQENVIRKIFRVLFKILTRTEIYGQGYIPKQGAFILATNHMSRVDVPLLSFTTPRSDLIALVADTYRRNLFFHLLIQGTGLIYIDRDKADFTAFRAGLEHLKQGGVLGIAPEGTRSRVGALLEGKNGVALLADRARVPVIPVGVSGTEDSIRKLLTLRKPRLFVNFGEPFRPPPIDRSDREGSLQRNTDEIMCRIAALLPPQYRG
ncbi:MAG: lysophospholipid acyltransferase family protein, partial [Anaerolineaceae bacterium]|nr:lysophospholipid acyltransferase family protein [Anaerolineaceae bacterium]